MVDYNITSTNEWKQPGHISLFCIAILLCYNNTIDLLGSHTDLHPTALLARMYMYVRGMAMKFPE